MLNPTSAILPLSPNTSADTLDALLSPLPVLINMTVILSPSTTTGMKTTNLFMKPFPYWISWKDLSDTSLKPISKWFGITASMHATATLIKNSAALFLWKSIGFFYLSTVGVTVYFHPSAMTRWNVPNAHQPCFFWNFTSGTIVFLWMNYTKGQWQNTADVVHHLHLVQFPPAVVNYL